MVVPRTLPSRRRLFVARRPNGIHGFSFSFQVSLWYDGPVMDAGDAILGGLHVGPLLPPPNKGGLMQLLCSAPPEICCAIDNRICVNPITICGSRFERASLELWASRSARCPATGAALDLASAAEDLVAVERSIQWLSECA